MHPALRKHFEELVEVTDAEFERIYLAELFSDVERAMPIMEELDRLLSNARSQCE